MIAILIVPFMIFGILGIMWVLNRKSWKAKQHPYGTQGENDASEGPEIAEDKSV